MHFGKAGLRFRFAAGQNPAHPRMRFALAPALLVFVLAARGSAAPVDFNRDVQPILSENCYHCHGQDGKKREADLRLDRKEGAYRTKDGVTTVKPGDPDGSELIVRIFSTDKEDVMPPPKSHRELTQPQKELLKRWVKEGAPWADHWAFVAPKLPEVPPAPEGTSAVNAIDRFVFSRLAAEGLKPAPEAARETLIRRVTLDLTGLPPTLEE